METYRCFVAIGLPNTVKKTLADLQQGFRTWRAGVKWVEQNNFHLTLKFLGDVPRLRLAELEAGLGSAAAAHRSFVVRTAGLGAFPNPRRPKVIWVGIDDKEGRLPAIWQSIEQELADRGFAREEKRFSPHLTLGRVRDVNPPPGFAGILQTLKAGSLSIPVTELKLMSSRLFRNGPEYSCLDSFTLQ